MPFIEFIISAIFITKQQQQRQQQQQQKHHYKYVFRGTQRQFSENLCSEDDLRSRIFGTFFPKLLACLPLQGFSNN